jgi:exodeoxyribonuclease VII large subunit
MIGPRASARVLTVSELSRALRRTLDRDYGEVWVSGELSGVRRAPSGHVYFTLKDERSQLAAVLFRSTAATLPFTPRDGLEVVMLVRVGLYPERGALQLYVETMEPLGAGALRLAFEEMKARLEQEGLFAAARKRPLPSFPAVVGLVTSLHGAAVRDMRAVLAARWPQARVVIRPVQVQGAEAAPDVAAGIAALGALPELDVMIVGRGGGSLEDLWAFNTEVVARAIAAAPVPVISAVGHEIDFTIADFVADVRAPTPTAGAALAVPDRRALLALLAESDGRLRSGLRREVRTARLRLETLRRGIGDPGRRVADLALRLDELTARGRVGLVRRLRGDRDEVRRLGRRLRTELVRSHGPARRAQVEALRARLGRALVQTVATRRYGLARAAGKLEALSPLACLGRGYAIVRQGGPAGPVVRQATALAPGEAVALRFASGGARATIVDTEA